MLHSMVEAETVSSKPLVGVGVHISTGGRRGPGSSALSPTRASSLLMRRAEGSVKSSSPKLVWLTGTSSTRTDDISPYLSSGAKSSILSRIFGFCFMSAFFVARRGCRAWSCSPTRRLYVFLIVPMRFLKCLSILSKVYFNARYISALVSSLDPALFWGIGSLLSQTALLLVRGILALMTSIHTKCNRAPSPYEGLRDFGRYHNEYIVYSAAKRRNMWRRL